MILEVFYWLVMAGFVIGIPALIIYLIFFHDDWMPPLT